MARVLREAAPFLGLGTNLAVTVGMTFAMGYGLDRMFETTPLCSLAFGSAGIGVALFQFIRTVSRMGKKG